MLIRDDYLEIKVRGPVKDREEIHFKSAIGGCEFPRIQIAALGNMECNIGKLVSFPVVEEYILGCG